MRISILHISIFCILLSSCIVYEPIQIQVLKPAEKNIDASVSRVLFFNHANYKKSSFVELAKENIDSIRTMEYFAGLAGVVDNTPRFQLVQGSVNYVEKESFNKRFEKLDWYSVEKACNDSAADAAIVLENYQITYTDPIKLIFSEEYGFYGKLAIENTALWRIYNPKNKSFTDDYLFKDTLFWDATGYSEAEVLTQLPDINEAIMQSCWYAGQKFGQHIAPNWIARKRYLMNCENTDFQQAINLAKNNNWEQAIEIWKKYPYGKKIRFAAIAAYNLAVASETLDHIDIALEWAAKSYLTRNDEFVKRYIDLLEDRKKEKESIFKQAE